MNVVTILMTLLTSVLVPIVVAYISSGKVANNVTKKMRLDDVVQKVDNLDQKVDALTEKVELVDSKVDKVDFAREQDQAISKRTRILRFNGEIMRGTKHNKEEFDDCIEAIDDYEDYCEKHPDFPNNKCVFAVNNVKRVYKECIENNSF